MAGGYRKGSGRPNTTLKRDQDNPEYVTSMATAVRVWGIPLMELKRAKREGCLAFTSSGGRIYRDALLEWLKANPRPVANEDDLESEDVLKVRKLAKQIEMLELDIQRKKENLILKSTVKDEWSRFVAILCEEAQAMMSKDHYSVFISRIKHKLKGEDIPG